MAMNAITQSRSDNTRQHILSVAKSLILGKGFSAVGLNEILKAAEVPKGSFYHYFGAWKSSQCSDITSDKCLVVKLSGEVSDLSEAMRLALKQGTQRVIERLAECIQYAVDNKEIILTNDAEVVTKELYYLWIGATLMTKVNHTPDAFDIANNVLQSRLKSA